MKKFVLYPVLLTALTFALLVSSCRTDTPEVPVITTPADSLPFDIIWKRPLNITDSTGSHSPYFKPVIIGDVVINANNVYKELWISNRQDTVTAYDLKTGRTVWKWSNFTTKEKSVSHNAAGSDFLCVTNGREVVCLRAADGRELFRRASAYGQNRISVSEDIVFHVDEISSHHAAIRYYDKNTSCWKTAVSIDEPGDYDFDVFPPTAEVQPNGDVLLFFQQRNYHKTLHIDKGELFCYNMTQQKTVWNITVDSSLTNIANPPLIDQENLYFCSSRTVYCYDKKTGQMKWKKHFPHTTFTDRYLLTEHMIIIGSDTGLRIGITKHNGAVIYEKNSWIDFDQMAPYKDWIIQIGFGLNVWDIRLGEIKMKLDSPRKPGNFNTGVAIDQSTGLFYLPDGYYMMCIKVKGL